MLKLFTFDLIITLQPIFVPLKKPHLREKWLFETTFNFISPSKAFARSKCRFWWWYQVKNNSAKIFFASFDGSFSWKIMFWGVRYSKMFPVDPIIYHQSAFRLRIGRWDQTKTVYFSRLNWKESGSTIQPMNELRKSWSIFVVTDLNTF